MPRLTEKEMTLKVIVSCLTSTPDAVTLHQLPRDYHKLTEEILDPKKFGYSNLRELLLDSPNYVRLQRKNNIEVVLPVITQKLARVNNLVQNQKLNSSRKPAVFQGRRPYAHVETYEARPVSRKSPHLGEAKEYNYPKQNLPTNNFRETRQLENDDIRVTFPTGNQPRPRSAPIDRDAVNGKSQYSKKTSPEPSSGKPNSLEEELMQLLAIKKLSVIEERTTKSKKNKYQHFFRVDGKVFSNCPDYEETEEVAKNKSYAKCVKYLTNKTTAREAKSTYQESTDREVAYQRVLEITKNLDEGGRWLDSLEREYEEKYSEKIPAELIEKGKRYELKDFYLKPLFGGKWALYHRKFVAPKIDRNDPVLYMQNLKPGDAFPAIVSNIQNAQDVTLRILYHNGDEVDPLPDLTTELELFYFNAEIPAQNLVEKEYYCHKQDTECYRVQLLSLCEGDAHLYFVDTGNEEVVSPDTLFVLDKKFRDIPFMAVNCSLYGLELTALSVKVSQDIFNRLYNTSVFARIEHFSLPKYAVSLFDTQTDKDIDINQEIIKSIEYNICPPVIGDDLIITGGYITHATSHGDLFAVIRTPYYELLEKARKEVIEKAEKYQEDVVINSSCLGNIYLTKYSTVGEWHRGILREWNPSKVVVEFMDLGFCDAVDQSHLIPLEKLNPVYAKVAPQTVKCRLLNVLSDNQKWTATHTEQLLEMIKPTLPLSIKISTERSPNKPLLVELFKRVSETSRELVSINASLAHDPSFFLGGDSNNNGHAYRGSSKPRINALPTSLSEKASPTLVELDRAALKELPVRKLPEVLEYFDVIVSFAASPSNFVVQPYKTYQKWKTMMKEMQSFYDHKAHRTELSHVVVKGFYVALHIDSTWKRVQILSVDGSEIVCYCVDEGQILCCSLKMLQPLNDVYRSLPGHAIKAALGGIRPINGDWTPEDCCRFRALVEGNPLVSKILQIKQCDNDGPVLHVSLCNTQVKDVDIYIANLLVEEKRAQWCA